MKGAQLAAAVKFSRAGTAEKPGFLHTDLDSEADKEHNLTKARLTGRGLGGRVRFKAVLKGRGEGSLELKKGGWQLSSCRQLQFCRPCWHWVQVNKRPFDAQKEYKAREFGSLRV